MSQLKKLEIRDRVRAFRERSKMSQEQLGDMLGVSGNYVYLIESGKKTPSESLLKLFETMEGSPAYQSERMILKDEMQPARSIHSFLETETLIKNLTELSRKLMDANEAEQFRLLETITEIVKILLGRFRPKTSSSTPPSAAGALTERAGDSYDKNRKK